MKIPTTLPVTAEQSRASRFQLGLTQANVIEESNLPGHKLKNFETGRFIPDMPFLESLRDYYTQKGIDFTETVTITDQIQLGQQAPAAGGAMIRPVSRMCFYVSDNLRPEVVNQVLERMDQNDERIAGFLKEPVKSGLLSEFSEETEKTVQEIFSAMAENYLAFRFLQGRSMVSPPKQEQGAATISDIVGKFFAASPLSSITSPATNNDGKPTEASGEVASEGGEE